MCIRDSTFTTNCENNRVSVAPGKTADVTVTVTVTDEGRTMLAQFPNLSLIHICSWHPAH